jgi:hypothetical protein
VCVDNLSILVGVSGQVIFPCSIYSDCGVVLLVLVIIPLDPPILLSLLHVVDIPLFIGRVCVLAELSEAKCTLSTSSWFRVDWARFFLWSSSSILKAIRRLYSLSGRNSLCLYLLQRGDVDVGKEPIVVEWV